jgi:uncharacterized protein (TIGR03084 family)
MAVLIPDLCRDLTDETDVLVALLDSLDDAGWDAPTPADAWSIKDQIAHLAFFDGAVVTAVTDPERFRADLAELTGAFVEEQAARDRARSGRDTLTALLDARAAMREAFLHADLSQRVPWYGTEMSVASALTARIMETWAHGQDVFDAVQVVHPNTAALRQVAHIGVRALPNSYAARRMAVPVKPVRVELDAPDGSTWTWGHADASERVTGPAVDFCLVVTQRRNLADTAVHTSGDIAGQWMLIAQAFAGPPGSGRQPGQFRI